MTDQWCPKCSPEYINGKPSCSCKCHRVEKPDWAAKCELIIFNASSHHDSHLPKETLRQIMEVLEDHGFVDSDWRCESDEYFDS